MVLGKTEMATSTPPRRRRKSRVSGFLAGLLKRRAEKRGSRAINTKHDSDRCPSTAAADAPLRSCIADHHYQPAHRSSKRSSHYVAAYVLTLFLLGSVLVLVAIFCGRSGGATKKRKINSKGATRSRLKGSSKGGKKDGRRRSSSSKRKDERDVDAATTPIKWSTSSEMSCMTDDEEESGLWTGRLTRSTRSTEEEEEEAVAPIFPKDATDAELRRFTRARDGDLNAACEQLRCSMDWRDRYYKRYSDEVRVEVSAGEVDGPTSGSERDWRWACAVAVAEAADAAESEGSAAAVAESGRVTSLPCVVFLDDDDSGVSNGHRPEDDNAENSSSPQRENIPSLQQEGDEKASASSPASPATLPALRSIDGTRLCHHLPARIDPTLAPGKTYATALALYLDRRLSRDDEEKFDVFIDTRPGKGWANISAIHLVPFIKHAAKLLNDLHPERLHRAVVYPVPSVCAFIWNRLVKPFMDPVTADKIWVLGGSAGVASKAPRSLNQFVTDDVLDKMERRRLDLFC